MLDHYDHGLDPMLVRLFGFVLTFFECWWRNRPPKDKPKSNKERKIIHKSKKNKKLRTPDGRRRTAKIKAQRRSRRKTKVQPLAMK